MKQVTSLNEMIGASIINIHEKFHGKVVIFLSYDRYVVFDKNNIVTTRADTNGLPLIKAPVPSHA